MCFFFLSYFVYENGFNFPSESDQKKKKTLRNYILEQKQNHLNEEKITNQKKKTNHGRLNRMDDGNVSGSTI